jgi:hypothetical protein
MFLAGHYDPNGGYAKSPPESVDPLTYEAGQRSQGMVSLSAQDFNVFEQLCRMVKYKLEVEVQKVGGGGAMVAIRDLAAAIGKTTPETLIEVDAPCG